ncbi:MAG: hypothetical protein Q7S09_04220 [bacterium]|nr:hypothetical protein [bacterium]
MKALTQNPRVMNWFKKDGMVRRAIARMSHVWFFYTYIAIPEMYEIAPFQKEMFNLTQDDRIKNAAVIAFRNSGKSTIMTTSFPLWAVMGRPQKKFVVILAQTRTQARQHLANIRQQLEGNELLKKDLGPFQEEKDEWGAFALNLTRYGARIMAASSEQSIRGLRHGHYRPDLVVIDDCEDLASVKTREGRDKIHQWIIGDILPVGDRNTKFIFVGNLLHEDSALMRIKNAIVNGSMNGICKMYPLVDDDEHIAWPGKFPSEKEIDELRRTVGDQNAWLREFMLKIIPDQGRVVYQEWIHYYDNLPPLIGTNFRETVIGVDLAVTEKESADYTALVTARVHGYGADMRLYLEPFPVNERMEFPDVVDRIIQLYNEAPKPCRVLVEQAGTQRSLPQMLARLGVQAEEVSIAGKDKRARLAGITSLIKTAKILFARKGHERLIEEMTGFGVEKHDDLADALVVNALNLWGRIEAQPAFAVLSGVASMFDPKKNYAAKKETADEENERAHHEHELRLYREANEQRMNSY